ncbi:glycosyltransferase family 2 protein [Xylanimonas protaetiae]|uniref:glycosyltransferase family 2 protein n=1 Tax=Xylanimonas protaetiae TaxID=2509457 RepID=UPI0013EAD5DF|nr:glycosyltransferase family 2 protein [Xylanimonas protaetiae]
MTTARTRLVSVVVVTYDTRDETLVALRSVAGGFTTTGHELVVVDNGTDGTADAVRAELPGVVVEPGANVGFAAAVNLAVAHASGDGVLLLNPDTQVLPGALQRLVDFADAHPAHGLYGGRTLRPDGTTDPSSCWGEPSLWSLACFALGLTTAFRRSRLLDPESLGRWERDTVREVPVVTGCLLFAPRPVWDALGGLDETYFLYGEDAELSVRARRRGLRPVVVPDATIVHAVGGSTASSGRKLCMVLAGKTTLLRSTWHPVAARAGVAMLATGVLLRARLETRRGRDGHWALVWERRADWLPGYPHARGALFGEPDRPAPDPAAPGHTAGAAA